MKKVSLLIALFSLGFVFCAVNQVQASPGENKDVFFIHHSTGAIYWQGKDGKGMEYYLEKHGYDANDVDYWDGNTDVGDWEDLFSQESSWDVIGEADIVMFKSCYPNSAIGSAKELSRYRNYYKDLYEIYEEYPDVLFVPFSTPPLPKKMTTASEAKRAKKFNKWMMHSYLDSYDGDNLAPFRLHYTLRNKNGYLKTKYVSDPYDGHPKYNSGTVVGRAIWRHLDEALVD